MLLRRNLLESLQRRVRRLSYANIPIQSVGKFGGRVFNVNDSPVSVFLRTS